MKPNRWRTTGRMLGAGLALVLLLGASDKGCSGGSSRGGFGDFGGGDFGCPKIEAAGTFALAAEAAPALPAGDLQDDIDRAREIAQRVTEARDGTCARSSSGKGYNVKVRLDDGRVITVRVMARSSSRKNYYRVSVSGRGAVKKNGDYSSDQGETHIDIDDPDDAVDNILDLIDKIKDDDA